MLAVLVMAPVALADDPVADNGSLDNWPRCSVFYVTIKPYGYQFDPDCLKPVP